MPDRREDDWNIHCRMYVRDRSDQDHRQWLRAIVNEEIRMLYFDEQLRRMNNEIGLKRKEMIHLPAHFLQTTKSHDIMAMVGSPQLQSAHLELLEFSRTIFR